jgi:hypothetical protein
MALTGINYPWLNYGWDFGDPPPGWSGGQETDAFRAAQRETIAKDLRAIAASGMTVVRWFLLADGLSYGTGPQRPTLDGKFHMLPPGDPWIRQMVEDFKNLLDLCVECKVQLLPSFIDFHWGFAPTDVNAEVVKGGRWSVFENDDTRHLFLETLFEPLLEASKAKREAIYAWEPMNEPEWCTGGAEWKFWQKPTSKNRNVSSGDMRAFLKEAVKRVNDAGFVSTVGFAHWETIREWDTEDWGIGLQQFHYYAQGNADLPAPTDVTSQPCLLGEYATHPSKLWPGDRQTLDVRMRRVEDLGYTGQLLWGMRSTDDATLWSDAQMAVVAKHNGRLPG